MASVGTQWFSSPNATSSPARAMTSCVSGSWNTMPVTSRASCGARPSTRSSPSDSPPPEGSRMPASAARSVLLPAPDAPSRSTRSPGSMRRSSPRTAQALRPACRQPQPLASTAAPSLPVTGTNLNALLGPTGWELREHAGLHECAGQPPGTEPGDDESGHHHESSDHQLLAERERCVEERYVVEPRADGRKRRGEQRRQKIPTGVAEEREP